jgi:hypothetical protein
MLSDPLEVRRSWGLTSGGRSGFVSTERIQELRLGAKRAREIALAALDKGVAEQLKIYATELEDEASKLEAQTLPVAAMDSPTGEPSTGPEAIAAMKPTDEPDSKV